MSVTPIDGSRLNLTIARFYTVLFETVDAYAERQSAEPITEHCGMIGIVHLVSAEIIAGGSGTETLVRLEVPPDELGTIIAGIDQHVRSDHEEYLPLFLRAFAVPAVRSLVEQLEAFAAHHGVGLLTLELFKEERSSR